MFQRVSNYSEENLRFSPLSLIAMHGKTKLFSAPATDEKACEIAKLLLNHGANTDDSGQYPNSWNDAQKKQLLTE